MVITEFNYIVYSYLERWDNYSLVIAYDLFHIIQSLTTMWFISERDILIVHYLAKTRGPFETLQQRCHKLAFWASSAQT